MNPYSGKIDQYTEKELKEANEALQRQYGQDAKQMIGITDAEKKELDPMNRAQRREWMKKNGKFKTGSQPAAKEKE